METTFKPEYCQMLIDHMAQGYAYETFGAKIKKGRSTLYDWEKDFPEWVEAKKAAQELAQFFFEEKLVAKIKGKKENGADPRLIDTSCLIFALKTRFHKTYSEKIITENVDVVEKYEDYLKRIQRENP